MQDRYITLKIHYSVYHTSKSSLLFLLETSITTNDGRKWTAYTNTGWNDSHICLRNKAGLADMRLEELLDRGQTSYDESET
jgi:hypothetical protein